MSTSSLKIERKTVRCTANEARELFAAMPAKAQRSLPGHALATISDALSTDGTADLAATLALLFPSEPLDKARRRLTTEIANRVYVDDKGNAPLKIVQTRKGEEPALIWLERADLADTRGLTEAGDRYAPDQFVPSEATQKTGAEIVIEIAKESAVIRGHATDATIIASAPPNAAEVVRQTGSPAYVAARNQAIANLVKPNNAANDSLRGSNMSAGEFTATDAMRAEGFSGLTESAHSESKNTVNALDAMLAWAADSRATAPKLLALLGDYGTGKTSHVLQFSRVLNGDVAHPKRPDATLSALHIDLAYLRGVPGLAHLNVTQIVAIVIDARGLNSVLSADAVVREVREGRRILVYDGLDELMQSDHAQLHSVFRQLLQVLEPDPVTRGPSHARLIVSCRTHYFRDLTEQHEFFNTQMRRGVTRKDYLCLYLLPWKPATVRDYLNRRLSSDEASVLSDTIANTYNLEELASRPVLLAMMCEQVGEVLRMRDAGGGAVTASTLYAQTVAMWVRRDDEKHVLQATHKPVLMGALACAMWNEGKEFWEADRLDLWLRKTVDALFPRHYSPEQTQAIQDDLRTATFIVRPGRDGFTFAHRSFMEFFLARHLVTLMDSTDIDDHLLHRMLPTLDLSSEVLAFLRDIMIGVKDQFERRGDRIWRWLAYDIDPHGAISFSVIPRAHTVLFGIAVALRISCKSHQITANLRDTDFRLGIWKKIKCPRLDLRGADLRGLRAIEICAGEMLLDRAKVSTTIFRDCALGHVSWGNTDRNQIMFRVSARKSPIRIDKSQITRPETLKPTPFWNDRYKIEMALTTSSMRTLVTTQENGRLVRFWDIRSGQAVLEHRGATDITDVDSGHTIGIRLPQSVVDGLLQKKLCDASDFFGATARTLRAVLSPSCLRLHRSNTIGVDETRVYAELTIYASGVKRCFVSGSSPSTACYDSEGRLVDYDEEAADTWLRYLGNGYPQPVEAAWLELDEFGRALGPKKPHD